MRVQVLVAVSVLAAALLPAGAYSDPAQPAGPPQASDSDLDQVVCRVTPPPTGTRLGGGHECHTQRRRSLWKGRCLPDFPRAGLPANDVTGITGHGLVHSLNKIERRSDMLRAPGCIVLASLSGFDSQVTESLGRLPRLPSAARRSSARPLELFTSGQICAWRTGHDVARILLVTK